MVICHGRRRPNNNHPPTLPDATRRVMMICGRVRRRQGIPRAIGTERREAPKWNRSMAPGLLLRCVWKGDFGLDCALMGSNSCLTSFLAECHHRAAERHRILPRLAMAATGRISAARADLSCRPWSTGRISAARAGLPRRPWLASPPNPTAPTSSAAATAVPCVDFVAQACARPLFLLRNARCRPPPRGPSSAPATGGRRWPSPQHSRLGGRRVATGYGRACCVR
jgi:hypothetical protein